MTTRRSSLKLLAIAALPALLALPAAHAQPMLRQLTIVVAFPAGGATDARR